MGFEKTEKQKEATRLLASSAKNVMLYGGSRSGKTFAIVRSIIIRASKVQSRHLILRQNFNHAKRSIWLDTLPKVLKLVFPDLYPKSNNSDFYLKLHNGSEIWVGGLDDEKNVEKILGNEYSTIYFNECSQIPYSSIQIAKTRLAEKNDLVKKSFYDMNPPTKAHWSYWLFEKKLNPSDEGPIADPDNYKSLLMNPKDNLQNIDKEYLDLLAAMPEKERNRFLEGLFNDESEGQVYYAFKREIHTGPLSRNPGSIFVGMDFNVQPMTAVILQCDNERAYVIDEIFLENSDTEKMANQLIIRGYGGAVIFPDSTGANRKTSGKTDFQILRDKGFIIESTRNPFVTDRVNNMNRIMASNKIVVDPKCKKLINDLEKVVWKDNKPDQSGANKMLTHISDALGYALWKLLPFNHIIAKIEFQTPKGR